MPEQIIWKNGSTMVVTIPKKVMTAYQLRPGDLISFTITKIIKTKQTMTPEDLDIEKNEFEDVKPGEVKLPFTPKIKKRRIT